MADQNPNKQKREDNTNEKKLTNSPSPLKEAASQDSQSETSVEELINSSEIHKAVEAISLILNQKWQFEQFNPEIREKVEKSEVEEARLAKKSNKMSDELEAEKKKTKPAQNIIEKLNKDLKELDDKIDKIREERMEDEQRLLDYEKSMLERWSALKTIEKESGININRAAIIEFWKLFEKAEYTGSPGTLKGIEYEDKTGKASKISGFARIKEIKFKNDKTAPERDVSGEMSIIYTDDDEEEKSTTLENYIVSNHKNFINFSNALEAYEKMDMETFLERNYSEILADKLEVGQTYIGKRLTNMDENGNKKYQDIRFNIEEVGDDYVVVSETLLSMPAQRLANSVDNRLYFDRVFAKGEKIPLGKFSKYLKQYGVKRDVSSDGNLQNAINIREQGHRRKARTYMDGSPQKIRDRFEEINGVEAQDLTIPEPGQTQNIVFLDKYRHPKRGKLRTVINDKGEKEYEIEYPKAKNLVKNRMSANSFMEAIDKDEIQNEPVEVEQNEKANEEKQNEMESEESVPREESSDEGGVSEGEKQYRKDALPLKDVVNIGGTTRHEKSYLKALWADTRFISISDLWEMGKTMWDYYKKRFERKQKGRYSDVGQNLPFFAPEMQRINQAEENQQVRDFQDYLEQAGVWEVQEIIRSTKNRDELKAGINVLTDMGQMRWDDIEVWKNINNFLDPEYAIPIPASGNPYTRMSETDDRTGLDFLREALDSIWGNGSYNGWYSKNNSSFASNAKGYYEEGNELESLEGGHARRLKFLLHQHKEGKFVDPQEFEGLILHAIDNGKSSLEVKFYYMIEGVAAENPDGRTILSFDRIAHINSTLLGKFPMLEYITASVNREGGSHRFTVADYKYWIQMFDEGNPMNSEPTQSVNDFLWKYVIPSDEYRNRVNKGLRNAETMDHDDMYAILPAATEEVVINACRSTTGSKYFLTTEGYANVFPGFSQYMRSLAEAGNKQRLLQAIKSYIQFEGIMTNKKDRDRQREYAHLDGDTLDEPPVVGNLPTRAYLDQLSVLMKDIIRDSGDAELQRLGAIIYGPEPGNLGDPVEKKKQNEINHAFEIFGSVFGEAMKKDGGEMMLKHVQSANLRGMIFKSDAEKERARKIKVNKKTAL